MPFNKLVFAVLVSISFFFFARDVRAAGLTVPKDFGEAAELIAAKLTGPELTPESCSNVLLGVYNAFYKLNPQHFTSGLDGNGIPEALTKIFNARAKVRERLRDWVVEEKFGSGENAPKACARYVRVVIRLLRGMEDYWGVHYLRAQKQLTEKIGVFQPGAPHTFVNPSYKASWKFDASIEPGDILLSRGPAFTSAVIGRVGAIDNQWSHLSVIHFEDGTILGPEHKGKKFVIEAELNGGLLVTPWEKYLTNKARIAVFRFKNIMRNQNVTPANEIAKRASEVLARMGKTGKVCYNFGMDMKDTSCLFCSQSVSVALGEACKDPKHRCEKIPYAKKDDYPIPLFTTGFNPKANPILQMLAVKVTETFAPADVEVEPRLDFIAEWRNYALMPKKNPLDPKEKQVPYILQARVFDAILTQMFYWMEKGGYKMRENAPIIHYGSVIAEAMVKDMNKMPPNTPSGFVKGSLLIYFLMEHNGPGDSDSMIANALAAKLRAIDATTIREFAKEYKLGEISDAEITAFKENAAYDIKRLVNHVGFTPRMVNANNAHQDKTGFDLTDYQLALAMEGWRRLDCKDLQTKGTTGFHDLFAPHLDKGPMERCSPNELPQQ